MRKDQAAQHLYRLYQAATIFDKDIQIALNVAILELMGESGELPEKIQNVLKKIEIDTNRLMQMHTNQTVLDDAEGDGR